MALTVITGAANSGKTGFLYRPLVEAARAGGEAVLLVPSHADVLRARAEFTDRAPVGIHVTSFEGYAEYLWQLQGDGRRFVTGPLRHLAIRRLLAEKSEPLLAEYSSSSGFTRVLADVVTRTAGMPLQGAGDATTAAVAALCRRYREIVAEWGRIEPGEALLVLAAGRLPESTPVSVNRFTDLSAQQEVFLSGLARTCDVRLSLTYRPGDPATLALQGLAERLAAGGAAFIDVDEAVEPGELAALSRALFSGGEVARSGQVSFFETVGPEAEVAAVADAVSEAIGDGVAPERIVVAFRTLCDRHTQLEAALAGRDIEVEVDVSLAWSDTSFGRAMLTLLALSSGGGSREDLVGLLRTGYTDTTSDRVDMLDRHWRRHRITDVSRMLDDCAGRGGRLEQAIRAARTIAGERCGPEELTTLADTLLRSASRLARGDTDERLDAAAHRTVIDFAEALSDVPWQADFEAVTQGLAESRVSTGASERPGAVVVTEAHRIRGRRFDVVVLGGLSGAEFSSGGRESLATSLVLRLGAPAGPDSRLTERMLFHALVTRARERLVVVRQAVDARGEATRPSVFWDEAMSAYSVDDRDALVTRIGGDDPGRSAPVFDPGRRRLRSLVVEGGVGVPRVLRGHLDDVSLVATADDEFSITEIEAYLRCPYAWFYDRVLRPRALDQAFDAREKGSVAHALLARVYRAIRAEGHSRVGEGCLQYARQVLDREAEQLLGEQVLVGLEEELAWEQAVRWCWGVLEADETFLAGFAPVAEEWRFGKEAGRPFVFAGIDVRGAVDRVDLGPAGLVVTDYKSSSTVAGLRHFVDEPHLQPIIYASAAAQWLKAPIVAGLYRSLSSGAVAGYWNVDRVDPEPLLSRMDHLDEEGLADLVGHAEAQVRAAVHGMREGRIAPAPTKGACDYCGARFVCGGCR